MAVEEKRSDETTVLAIDIGGGSTKLALVNPRGIIRNWQSFPTIAVDGEAFVAKLVASCRTIQKDSQLPIAGVSAAIAGFVLADGSLEFNANLPWLEGTPIAKRLAEELSVSVIAEADSNSACIAEYVFGEGQGANRFLCLTGGTGLGVGMIVENRILRIAHRCMGDAGHVIVAPDGPECSCGGRGCAEAIVSTAALSQKYGERVGLPNASFRDLVEAGEADVPSAREALEEAGYWLGIAVASLASIFLPDRIAIAGGLSRGGDAFFAAARRSFEGHAGHLPLSSARLICATTGENATLLGAAAGFFYPQYL